jgi:hypothetical protein
MRRTNRSIVAGDIPLRLSPEEIKAPEMVLRLFLQSFDLENCRDILWLAFSLTLCSADETIGIDYTRTEILAFYEETERLIEAVCVLRSATKGP